ncbi:MAG: GAF domain-containing sensor histidine kinase [Candidatus Binatia bacterium]
MGRPAAPDAAALEVMLAPLADRQPRLRARVGDEPLPWATPGGTWVALPVLLGDTVAGAVVLSAPSPRAVDEAELLLWRAMASQVGAALESARLFARLQEALRARSEFVDTMSHELRSPLHVILGYAEMLADGRGDAPAAAARIRANALELLQLVENTLAVARLGGGRLAVHVSEFALRGLIDELRESLASQPEAGASVEWIVEDLPPLSLDRLKVKEIVHNLVSNALKFAAAGPIVVRAYRAGDRVGLEVRDAGPGISPADQRRIFDLFERGAGEVAARASGAGLGLYIVRSLTDLMGGEVTLESTPGQGARFTVWLPIRFEAR